MCHQTPAGLLTIFTWRNALEPNPTPNGLCQCFNYIPINHYKDSVYGHTLTGTRPRFALNPTSGHDRWPVDINSIGDSILRPNVALTLRVKLVDPP